MKLNRGQDWTEEDKIFTEPPTGEYPFWVITIKKNDGSTYLWQVTGNVIVYKKQDSKDSILEIEYISINE